jgi:hypothetical protein
VTRDEIAEALMELVLEIGNGVGSVDDDALVIARRAFVRGLASHAILQLRDRLLSAAPGTSVQLIVEDQR